MPEREDRAEGLPEPLEVLDAPRVHPKAPEEHLRPMPGVQNIQVWRATREATTLFDPDQPPQPGWTYHHHQDLACWKGRLYAAWAATPKDEDLPPYRVLYSTSADGRAWSRPAHLFPPGQAWANRFYFYRASNGCMLAMTCAALPGVGDVKESAKTTLLVRRIGADHRLGEVHTLIQPIPSAPPPFEESADAEFRAACREAAEHRPLLEQQDYGRYLGDRRMKWHQPESWPEGALPTVGRWVFGKAFCFFHRADGALVGVCKMGWATLSADGGRTWSLPVRPGSLVTGSAKVWAQRTQDGRYLMVYNPHPTVRFPLVATTGDDGITFRGMNLIHGEVPPQRYVGRYKNLGPQYIRGVAEWAGDAPSPTADAVWVIYSISKEDIWVSRIPVPAEIRPRGPVRDTFDSLEPGREVPGWNLYCPAWASVRVAEECAGGNRYLRLENREPYDYARAVRVFPDGASGRVSFRLRAEQADRGRLEIDLLGEGGRRPVRLALDDRGRFLALDGPQPAEVGRYRPNEWLEVAVEFRDGRYWLEIDGQAVRKDAAFAEPAAAIYAVSFRTGETRAAALALAERDLPNADEPLAPAAFGIDDVTAESDA